MRRVRSIALLAIAAAWLAWPASRAWADEVLVVVDTSASMRTNDPDHLAVLATLVLTDLLRRGEDDLAVVPFDIQMGSPDATASATPIRWSQAPDTPSYRDRVQAALPYDGQATYFSPPLAVALRAFQGTGGRKLAILLTDGNSLDPGGDQARLEREILPAARQGEVAIWVVGLGPSPSSESLPRFFEHHRQGGYVEAPTARDLPAAFADVFGRSLGRRVEVQHLRPGAKTSLQARPAVSQLDLVAIAQGVLQPQHLALAGPSGAPWTGAPGDDVGGEVRSRGGGVHSYRRVRLAAPATGAWTISSSGALDLLVVRRFRYELQLSAAKGATEVPVGASLCMEARVLSRASASAQPMPVTTAADLAGLEVRVGEADASSPERPLYDAEPMRDDGATPQDAAAGDGVFGWCHTARPAELGLTLLVEAQLSADGIPYADSNEFSFQVIEGMDLKPTPTVLQFGATAPLESGAAPECHTFRIGPPDSQMPANGASFLVNLTGVGAGSAAGGGSGPLRNLAVTLDGQPLLGSVAQAPIQVTWSLSNPDHQVCATAGHRYSGGQGDLLLTTTPVLASYADRGVRGEVRLRVNTARPGFLEAWGGVLAILGVAAAVSLLLVLTRRRPRLPPGLHVACWTGDPDRPTGWNPCAGRRYVCQPIGLELSAEPDGLHATCSRSVEVRDAGSGAWVAASPGSHGLELWAGTTYRVGDRYFRLGDKA